MSVTTGNGRPAVRLSLAQARRVALAAQGFGGTKPIRADAGHLRRTLDRLGLFQIDSVNVLARAHYLPAFSRLGGYDRALLDRSAWGRRGERRMFEYWAHEASLLPLDLHPLLRWRMADAERGEGGWKGLRPFATERRAEADAVLTRIRNEGALTAADFTDGAGSGGWWGWSAPKQALEWLFRAGLVTTATRRNSFARVYDLPERVIPAAIRDLPTPTPAEAQRALMAIAGRALGVATETDLRDYFRLAPEPTRVAIAELEQEGTLLPATVEGWTKPAWLHRDARLPRTIRGRALLSPFDPLVWHRDRTVRLFGFHYRIGIYTPAVSRTDGYYALPFLLDERLVARVDLKADRERGRIEVRRIVMEPDAPGDTRDHLDAEVAAIGAWLELRETRDLSGHVAL